MLLSLLFRWSLNRVMELKNECGSQVLILRAVRVKHCFLFIRGVKSNEIILSQLIIHSVILVIQIVIVLFTALYLFQVNLKREEVTSLLISVRFHPEAV
jgi:hypothetical protein